MCLRCHFEPSSFVLTYGRSGLLVLALGISSVTCPKQSCYIPSAIPEKSLLLLWSYQPRGTALKSTHLLNGKLSHPSVIPPFPISSIKFIGSAFCVCISNLSVSPPPVPPPRQAKTLIPSTLFHSYPTAHSSCGGAIDLKSNSVSWLLSPFQ